MFRLELFGGARINGPDGPLTGRISQRRQLALLSFLALQDRPTTRDRLLAMFWPESDAERARHALSDAVYVIRRAMGDEALRSVGDDLMVDTTRVHTDVAALEEAIAEGRFEASAELYAGPFLDGVHLRGAPAFEAWTDAERDRLRQLCLGAAESVATRLEVAGDWPGAVIWWRRAVLLEPDNSRVALRLTRALGESGDRAGALRCIATHARLLEEEYGITPSAEIAEYAATLREGGGSLPEPSREKPPMSTVGSAPEPARPGFRATPTGEPAAPAPRRWRVRPVWGFAAVFLLVTAVLILAMRPSRGGPVPAAALDPRTVVILPFRSAGLHPDLGYLREGMVDLMAAKLTGEAGGLRALPPAQVLGAAGLTHDADGTLSSHAAAIALARELGAGTLLLGSLVGGAASLSIQLTLTDVGSGRETAHAGVQGGEAELHDLVDRLVSEILSRTAREEEHRLAHLTSASLPALRVFLAARAAHRRGDYVEALRQYDLAMDLDSTFALAGLGAVAVSGWVGGSAPVANRGAAVARAYADRLSQRDRVGLRGRLTDSAASPYTAIRVREIEEALQRFPDHARLWYLLGDEFLHRGPALGIGDWAMRARQSFERAIELDNDYSEPVHHLATVLAVIGDTAAFRKLAARELARIRLGPVADNIQWLGRHLIGAPFQEPPLALMETDATLRWIGIVAQDYGIAPEDGDAAVRMRLTRPGIPAELSERRMGVHAWALNSGRPGEAARILRSLADVQPAGSTLPHRIAILTALFAGGDEVAGAAAARALEATPDTLPDAGTVRELNRCIVALWQLRHSPDQVARPRILSEKETFSADERPLAPRRRVCALARDAQWLARTGGTEWHAAIDRLERFIALGPIRSLVDDGQVEYIHLALAQLHESAGAPRAALAALRRRTYYNGWQPYLAAMLREEGRLAAALGDTAAARNSWTRYLAFRTRPERDVQREVDRIRSALHALTPDSTRFD